jgi:glucose/arabinose dehydrogenase
MFWQRLAHPVRVIICCLLVALAGWAPATAQEVAPLAPNAPPAASVSVKVQVPASMRAAPFDVDRYLTVPPNFAIAVYARISNARFMAVAPNGDLLVSQPNTGKVLLVRANSSGATTVSDFATGLRRPHDIVFHTVNGTSYVYIAETHQINRFRYATGDTTAHDRQIVVANLPDSSTPELGGAYGHELKNIALDSNHKLYVSIASTCNACLEDTVSNPLRGAIYQYNADGSGGRLFARGLRNAEGLAFLPGTNDLWAVVNNRDNIAYPFHNDWNGDGSDDYGKVLQSYVDNHPPEEFTRVRDGGNYGWPFCNPNPDTAAGLNLMPFDRDVQFNADGHVDCGAIDRINKGIQAHSAPLGLSFLQGTNFPGPYRAGAVTGLHGSWNRATLTGYKVAYFPWDSATQTPGAQQDLVSGWLVGSSRWGRPVDAVVDQQGALLISDDYSGTIYRLTYTPAVTSFTLINADTDQPISGYNPIPSGATLNLATLPSRRLNIRANTAGTIGSVRFAYDGNSSYKTENYKPYAIGGDANNGADYLPWTPAVGSHTLTATPYSALNAGGSSGAGNTIVFNVIDRAP